MRLIVRDTTEYTMAASAADTALVTFSGLAIPVGAQVQMLIPFRKSSGAGVSARVGLAINGTNVMTTGGQWIYSSTTNQAESGLAVLWFMPGDTNYQRVLFGFMQCSGSGGSPASDVIPAHAANLPAAAITSIGLNGDSKSSLVTLGVKNIHVWTL